VLWRHGREPCPARECVRCQLSYRRPPQLWRHTGLLERQLEQVDGFIAKSEFSRRKHAEFGFSQDMRVIPYFLPDDSPESEQEGASGLAAAPRHPNGGRPYFLFVGRLERIKGLDDVIPAMAGYPDADLLIAGDGEYGDRLRQLGSAVPNVRFLGRLAPEALRSLYRGALALVVPSVCYETFGIILIEAFRQGTPVLARRIGPFPEIVETSGGGFLFDAASELPALMRRLQGDPALRRGLSQQGRAAFLEHWTEDAVIPRYLDLIGECARRRGRVDIAERLTTGSVA